MTLKKTEGTKCCFNNPLIEFVPETIGQLYQDVIDRFGLIQLNKPVPGHCYRKMYKPLHDMDLHAWKRLPGLIYVTSPARLYMSKGWKYRGKVCLSANLFWKFEYKYEWGNEWKYDWMAVRLLSFCYIQQNITYNSKNQKQLTLF